MSNSSFALIKYIHPLNKAETALKYGDSQVEIWRRSYEVRPPALLLIMAVFTASFKSALPFDSPPEFIKLIRPE